MHNHRIVPEKTTAVLLPIEKVGGYFYRSDDTIFMPSEWTAEQLVELGRIGKDDPNEWDDIHDGYIEYVCAFGRLHRPAAWTDILDALQLNEKRDYVIFMPFSQWLQALISLAPLKGLTVEEIRKLNHER